MDRLEFLIYNPAYLILASIASILVFMIIAMVYFRLAGVVFGCIALLVKCVIKFIAHVNLLIQKALIK